MIPAPKQTCDSNCDKEFTIFRSTHFLICGPKVRSLPVPIVISKTTGIDTTADKIIIAFMATLLQILSETVSAIFEMCGYDPAYGKVTVSNRPDLAQFQCNGALPVGKSIGVNPRVVAEKVASELSSNPMFKCVTTAGPGFLNLTLDDGYLAGHVATMEPERFGVDPVKKPKTIIIDYGGANVAKPLHVGHLRSAIIGEALKRIAKFVGHKVVGDVHLGDWGLQMGTVISEIARRKPTLRYFEAGYTGPFPKDSPVTPEDLEEIYPTASAKCKEDNAALEEARRATLELQIGNPGYRALWQHIHDVSVADLRKDYAKLNIEFDLWLGESDTQDDWPDLVKLLLDKGLAQRSEGALIIHVDDPDEKKELAPLLLTKSNGAALYGTTDLATIVARMEEYRPDKILYVVDQRQSDHFLQVFRAAVIAGIAPLQDVELEHLGFGTMNGSDGKPFKTREGGVMKLKDLIQLIQDKALERMADAEVARNYKSDERQAIARAVGVAALKYGDLMNQPSKNYVFDLNRFASFEGKTGPYILYTAVRIKSILRKADAEGLKNGPLIAPQSDTERSLMLRIAALPDQVISAHQQNAPQYLCDYVYELASDFSAFYRDHHILSEENRERQASWITLSTRALNIIELIAELLAFDIPESM